MMKTAHMDYNQTKSVQGGSGFLERPRLPPHYLFNMERRWFSSALGEEARGPRWLKLTHKMKILLLRGCYYEPATHPHCVSFALWKWSWNLPSRAVGQIQVKQCRERESLVIGVVAGGWPCCPWTGEVTRYRPEERPRRTGAQRISKLLALSAPGDCPQTSPL